MQQFPKGGDPLGTCVNYGVARQKGGTAATSRGTLRFDPIVRLEISPKRSRSPDFLFLLQTSDFLLSSPPHSLPLLVVSFALSGKPLSLHAISSTPRFS